MGVLVGVFSMFMSKIIGNILTVLIGIVIAVIVYLVSLILLKGIDENDLNSMPGGRKVLIIVKKLKLL